MEIDINTPEFKLWMEEFNELHDRIVQVRCQLNEIGEIIAWLLCLDLSPFWCDCFELRSSDERF